MSQTRSRPFLALAVRDRDALLLERCFDPTKANRIRLASGEAAGEGDYLIAEAGAEGARVLERLAAGGSALASVYELAVRHGLDPIFPQRVMEDVEALLESPGIDDPTLADLAALPFCTVDGPGTRDLDQALHVARTDRGFRLHYALADASWFVALGSALHEEALRRASSFYLPGLVVPMLPRSLSEGIVSLNPEVDRRALIMVLDLDGEGSVKGREWLRGRIRSRARLAFGQVGRMLPGDPNSGPVDKGLLASLSALRDLGERLAIRRDREGVVRYRRAEVDLTLSADARRLLPLRAVVDPVERWNEEISVLCNVEGARFLCEGDTDADPILPIYRVHPAPPPEALEELERRIAGLVALHGLDPDRWAWRPESGQSLADYLRHLPANAEPGSASDRLVEAIDRQAVVTNLRSTFAAEPAPHYGVGAEVYGRFTAPMREMVGIYLHQETVEKLDGLGASVSSEGQGLRQRVIDGANRAKALQSRLVKEASRAAMDGIFSADLALPESERPRRRGTVLGLSDNKLYCMLDDPPLEVKVYLTDVAEAAGTAVELDPDGVAVHARGDGRVLVRLGDTGRLYVRRFDSRRDRWVFGLLAG